MTKQDSGNRYKSAFKDCIPNLWQMHVVVQIYDFSFNDVDQDRIPSLSKFGTSRTGTRSVRGTPLVRWMDGCGEAVTIVAPLGHEELIADPDSV